MLYEMSRREELLMLISDMYKDVYGTRPNGMFQDRSDIELEKVFDDLEVRLSEVIDQEAAEKQAAVVAFEKQITDLIGMGAGDRATALRRFRDSFGDDYYDDGYVEYKMNLPYGYLKG